jgi:rhamnulokinase
MPVLAGPTEAACWGNALVQARALGVLSGSLPEFRGTVRRSVRCAEYQPHEAPAWDNADKSLDLFTDAPS